MQDSRRIQPLAEPVQATIRPPGSKSITNRALVCSALANGRTELNGALDSEDTQVMIRGLQQLGVDIHVHDQGKRLVVAGTAGKLRAPAETLQVANSGTTMRFLSALATTADGPIRLDGVARMRERPIADLIEALVQLGAHIHTDSPNGCPPVNIDGSRLNGGTCSIKGTISSQFLSGLLMVAPQAKTPVQIDIEGSLVSQPYVAMTIAVMRAFGIEVDDRHAPHTYVVDAPQRYEGRTYEIEPDASAASYFWALAALTGGTVCIEGLHRNGCLQGDVAFCNLLEEMGCHVEDSPQGIVVTGGPLHGIDADMNAISDTVQTMAVVALFADGVTTIRNVGHIRHKETDRITDLARELRRLGAQVDEQQDGLAITPASYRATAFETYRDHRMAMALSLIGLKVPGIEILDPGCVDKTYPRFFDELDAVCRS